MVTSTKLRGLSPHARGWTRYITLCLFLLLSTFISNTSFGQVDFRQSANNDAGYTPGDVHWLNSILQQSNSTYVEGMSSLQRIILLNVESKASHTLTFSHQSIKSSAGSHAYDFITSWAQAVAVSNKIGQTSFNPAITLFGGINECGAEPGSDPTGYLSACETAHSAGGGSYFKDAILNDNMADPSLGGNVKDRIKAYEALAASINPGLAERSIRVWGNAPVLSAAVTFTGYSGNDQDANYSLTWNSTATTIVIEFGTHLAVGRDPFKTNTYDIGYGAGKGAGGISGGPYHVNLWQLDGASLGSQDNQIKAADVLIPPSCTVSGPPIICAEDGQKTYNSLVTDGGTNPTYAWSFVPTPNAVNAEFFNNTNLTASAIIQPVGGPTVGDYLPGTFSLSMKVTTTAGLSATCQLPSNVTVYKVGVTETHTDVSCNGGNTGAINITASGGVAPYVYDWADLSGTSNTEDRTGLAAGTYTVTVTDANGCAGSVSVTITQPPALTCSVAQDAPVLCYGQSNGKATVAALGGTAPYSYKWDNGATTASVTNLTAGTHTVEVTDSKGCKTTCQVTITEPPVLAAGASAGAVACNGGTTTITITATGGTAPYQYSLDGITYGSTNTFTRGAGSYTAYVKDANGCIDDAPVTVNQPSTVSVNAEFTPILCNGDNTTITLTGSGGTSPYTYSLDGVTYGSTNTFTRKAGTYTGYVKDANGCIDDVPITVSQPSALTATVSGTPILCFGGNTTITIVANGGTPPYSYSLDGTNYGSTATFTRKAGSYTAYVKDANNCSITALLTITEPSAVVASASAGMVACNGGTTTVTVTGSGGTPPYSYSLDGTTYVSTNTFTRGAGSYTAYVKDANGCIDDVPVTVSQPSTVAASASATPILCFGGNTTITVSGSGGTSPYTYSLDGITYGSTATFTRKAGTYTAYVKDANGCLDSEPITVGQPTVVVAGANTTPILCYGGNTTITLSGSGGTSPYTYSLDGVTYGSTATFTRTAGNYTGYVKDANGCIDDVPITVNQPPVLIASAVATPILCYDGNTTITVSATGGTTPYTYSLDGINYGSTATFTRKAGTYTAYVKDANGCIDDQAIIVNQPPLLTCTAALAKAADCGTNNGSATVTPTGGTAPYTYLWDNGETTATATQLSTGTHTVRVKDANNCETTCTVSIPELPCAITYCTYTQGAYGNAGGQHCTPDGSMGTAQTIAYSLNKMPGKQLVIGRTSNTKSFTIRHDADAGIAYSDADIQAVIEILPGGGGSKVLDKSVTASPISNYSNWLKSGRLQNSLLAQTITLGLNMYLTEELQGFELKSDAQNKFLVTSDRAEGQGCEVEDAIAAQCDPMNPGYSPYEYRQLNAMVVQYLKSVVFDNGTRLFKPNGQNDAATATVRELFELASAMLGGVYGTSGNAGLPTGVDMTSVSSVADDINNVFDECRVFSNYWSAEPVCPVFTTQRAVTSTQEVSVTDLKVAAYPNPYNNTVSFNFTSPVAGKASLEVYDLVGRRLAVIFEGQVDAGMQKAVNYNVPSAQRVPMIYRLSVGGKSSFGKLLPGNTD